MMGYFGSVNSAPVTGYVASIDQGTSSTRCIVFDHQARVVAQDQVEHKQIYPKAGWVEHDPLQIWENVQEVVRGALAKARLSPSQVAGVGITNQRESTLAWNRRTGKPYHNVIVWNDTRTSAICDRLMNAEAAEEGIEGIDRFRAATGLPIAPYFSGTKMMWLLENVEGLREAAEAGEALLGTVDSWLMWQLTGGSLFVTDVTNASRTMLMDIHTLQWDKGLLQAFGGIPLCALAEIRSSSEVYGKATAGVLEGVPIAGILGDQQAALFGQSCFNIGEAKSTYGTGAFILMNTGAAVPSTHGLLTTVGYQLQGQDPVYALEGSIAYAGSVVQWCRDALQIITATHEVEELAASVEDNGGLYAPYWRKDARGVVCGLTAYATKEHLARAVLEATAFQVSEVLLAMKDDAQGLLRPGGEGEEGRELLKVLAVDGGMTANKLLMQFQADILGSVVVRPLVSETTALGAAFSAGLAVGLWKDLAQLKDAWEMSESYEPAMECHRREALKNEWAKAIARSLSWVDDATTEQQQQQGEGGGGGEGEGGEPHQQTRPDEAALSVTAVVSPTADGGGGGGGAPPGRRTGAAVGAAVLLTGLAGALIGFAVGRSQRSR